MAGTYIFPINRSFLSLTGGTVTGDTNFIGNLTATTFYSGTTELGSIIQNLVGAISINNTGTGFPILSGKTGNTFVLRTVGAGNNLGLTTGDTIYYYLKDDISLNSVHSSILSGDTVFSGNTDLSYVFASLTSFNNQNTLNTLLFGTKVNRSGDTMTGQLNLPALSATTISGETFYSGATELSLLFASPISIVNLQNQVNTKVNRSGDTMTGQLTAPSISAVSISATTFYSASTDISNLFVSISAFNNQNLLNTNLFNTKVNRSGDTMTGQLITPAISATTLSGGTIYSGSTELSSLLGEKNTASNLGPGTGVFAQKSGVDLQFKGFSAGSNVSITTDVNTVVINSAAAGSVINGLNTYTGGTSLVQSVNVSGLNITTIIVSGASIFNTVTANTISGGTILSGSTDLSSLFANQTAVSSQNTLNTNLFNTKVNRSGDTMTGQLNLQALSAITISGGTILSGSTDLSLLFATPSYVNLQQTHIQPGTNTYTGGTALNPTVNISAATLQNLTVTGSSIFNTVTATTISGGTIFSGNTELSSLLGEKNTASNLGPGTGAFAQKSGVDLQFKGFSAGSNITITNDANTIVINSTGGSGGSGGATNNNGLNTYTGGTSTFQSINISAATLASLTVSGSSILSTLSATTLSAATLFSGVTDISNLFASQSTIGVLQNQVNTKVNRSGDTMTGQLIAPSLSATTISASTYYSGSTLLSSLLGEVNTGSNIGTGTSVFHQKIGVDFQFKRLSGASGIVITTGGTSGETIVITSIPDADSAIVVGASSTATIVGTYNNGSSGVGAVFSGSSNGAFAAQDGITLPVNELVLLRNQTSALQNGVYVVTSGGSASSRWLLTRYSFSDETSEFDPQLVFISSGNTLKGNYYNQSTASPVVGTDNIVYDLLGTGSATLFVTQLASGTQTNGNIPNWNGTSRQLVRGDTSFMRHPTTGNVGIYVTGSTPTSRLDVGQSIGLGAISGVSTNAILGINDYMILADATSGSKMFTLPSAVTCQRREYFIKKIDSSSNTVILSGGTNTIDGQTGFTLTRQNEVIWVKSSGAQYFRKTFDINDLLTSQIATKVSKSGDTMTGQLTAPAISATTLSGGTIFSGSTDLSLLFTTPSYVNSQQTHVQPGVNTYTGGTALNPTINVSGLSISNITVSGSSNFTSLSATTLSGGTIFSGSTPLETIIQNLALVGDYWQTGATGTQSIQRKNSLLTTNGNFGFTVGKGNLNQSNYSSIAGGLNNSALTTSNYSFIGAGHSNSVIGTHTFIGGGSGNAASGYFSFVGGGQSNSASGYYSFAGGGKLNRVSNRYSAVVGGLKNSALGSYSFVGGGKLNTASTQSYSSVVGGYYNLASGIYSIVGAGRNNTASGNQSFIGGGRNNIAAYKSSVVGGAYNTASGNQSFIGGGGNNIASGSYSSIVGGKFNSAHTSNYSFIGGGKNNYINHVGSYYTTNYSFIGGGKNNTIVNVSYYSNNNSAIVGGVGNIITKDNSVIVGGKNNSITEYGSFIGGGIYNTVSSSLSAIITGSLNINQGTNSFIGIGIYHRTSSAYSIVVGGRHNNSLSNFSFIANGSYNTANTSSYSTVINGVSNISSGFYSIILNGISNSSSNRFGLLANGSGNTASGEYSTVINGALNLASGIFSFIGNGISNNASGNRSFIGNGLKNSATTINSFIGNGSGNTASGAYSSVVGGTSNKSLAKNSAVVGGFLNTASTIYSFVGGGRGNIASGTYATVVGGANNFANANSSVAGGGNNLASGAASVAFGSGNVASNDGATAFGQLNTAGGISSFVAGSSNSASGYRSVAIGGRNHIAGGTNSAVIAGRNNRTYLSNNYGAIIGGFNNILSAHTSFIAGGFYNFIYGNYSAIIGGTTNKISFGKYGSVILGGTGLIANYSNTVLVPKLQIITPYTNGGSYNLALDTVGRVFKNSDISGSTIYSGLTNIANIFVSSGQSIGSGIAVFKDKTSNLLRFKSLIQGSNVTLTDNGNDITIAASLVGGGTVIRNGLNTYTGGSSGDYTVNVSGLNISNITVSGSSNFTTLSATSISGGTIFSASTDLSLLFASQAAVSSQNTANSNLFNTKVNRSGDTMTGQLTTPILSATTISATTYYSGSTLLSSLLGGGSGEVNTASNLGTGTGVFAQKSGVDLQFKGLSAGTNITLSNNSNTIVINSTGGSGGGSINNGTNTYTGGTSTFQSVNISAATLASLTVSGNSILNTLSATTISGGTIYSGNTELSNIFITNLTGVINSTSNTTSFSSQGIAQIRAITTLRL